MINEPNANTTKILVVEDNATNLKIVLEYLRDQAFELFVARHGEEGLKKAEYAQPDLILLDVMMPGIDGFETCRRLKENPKTKDIPVIFMTALTSEADKAQAFQVGGVDYVTKPLQQREIIGRINTHLQIRRQAQALSAKIHELQTTQDALAREKKLAIVGQLAGGVADELRSPLSIIANAAYYLNILLADGNDTIEEYLATISKQVEASEQILSNLFGLSYAQNVTPTPTAVSDVVADVLTKHPVPENIQLQLEMASDLPAAFADPHHLQQIIANLLNNAYQAMPQGGTLTIGARATQEQLHITISDTGQGISAEIVDDIFDPLFTTRAKGVGLGLAVSKNLVEANNGRISAESSPGSGSIFTVDLPIAVPTQSLSTE